MSFTPWHGLAALRPLVGIMRVRKAAYEAARKFRTEKNGRVIQEPRDEVFFWGLTVKLLGRDDVGHSSCEDVILPRVVVAAVARWTLPALDGE